MASSSEFAWIRQKPATSSFVSANGPSVTMHFPLAQWTRMPFELGWSLPHSRSAPALTSASLNLAISDRVFSSGQTPASKSLLALTINMNRIVESLYGGVEPWLPVSTRKSGIKSAPASVRTHGSRSARAKIDKRRFFPTGGTGEHGCALTEGSQIRFPSRSFLKNALESKTSDLAFFNQRRMTLGSIPSASTNTACAAPYLPTGLRPPSSNACPFQNKRLTVFAVAL